MNRLYLCLLFISSFNCMYASENDLTYYVVHHKSNTNKKIIYFGDPQKITEFNGKETGLVAEEKTCATSDFFIKEKQNKYQMYTQKLASTEKTLNIGIISIPKTRDEMLKISIFCLPETSNLTECRFLDNNGIEISDSGNEVVIPFWFDTVTSYTSCQISILCDPPTKQLDKTFSQQHSKISSLQYLLYGGAIFLLILYVSNNYLQRHFHAKIF